MHNTNRICDLAASPWVRSADHRRAVGRRILQNWIPATLPDNVQTWYESDTLGHVSSPTRTAQSSLWGAFWMHNTKRICDPEAFPWVRPA